jgi:hypothetical protein
VSYSAAVERFFSVPRIKKYEKNIKNPPLKKKK